MAGLLSSVAQIASLFLKPKAKAPELAPPVDLGAEQKKAIAGNLGAEPDIEALLARANSFNQDQNIALMEKAMPGYGELSKALTKTATSELADPYALPKDVEQNLARLAGERGISAGTKGEFNDFSLLRDFGINSLQFGQNRINQAQGITGLLASIAPKVNPMSPMSFYVTPGMAADVANTNRSALQANLNAKAGAANYNTADQWSTIMSLAGSLDEMSGLGKKTGNLVDTGGV